MAHLLVLDDHPDACQLIEDLLQPEGIDVTSFQDPSLALEHIVDPGCDAVLTDVNMPRMDGIEFCKRVAGSRPDVPVIVFTGTGRVDVAVDAMRAGAFDFVTKPVRLDVLLTSIRRALERRRLAGELDRLRVAATARVPADDILGSSSAIRRLIALVERVAPSTASVLIHGETGTGKELVARAIHRRSDRAGGPFVAVNCAAIQPSLIESELFGHVRGAFTDARENRRGLFLEAHGGTLFLDEIAELPVDIQPKLLRALQERTVRPVGANKETAFDARVISATHRVLEDEVAERRFREDLYYRLNVVRIDVPALRERRMDIPILARHILARSAREQGSKAATLTSAAIDKLVAYYWAGNVRELDNAMEHALALSRTSTIDVCDLPLQIQNHTPSLFGIALEPEEEKIRPFEEVRRLYVEQVLSVLSGNKTRAAQMLGIDRRTLYRMLDAWKTESSRLSQT